MILGFFFFLLFVFFVCCFFGCLFFVWCFFFGGGDCLFSHLFFFSLFYFPFLFLSSLHSNAETLSHRAEVYSKLIEAEFLSVADIKFFEDHPRVQHAIENFERAINAHATVETLFAYAQFLEKCGNYKKAEQCYLSALEKNPNHVDTLKEYGNFLSEMGKHEAAEQFYVRCSEATKKWGVRMELKTNISLGRSGNIAVGDSVVGAEKGPVPAASGVSSGGVASSNASGGEMTGGGGESGREKSGGDGGGEKSVSGSGSGDAVGEKQNSKAEEKTEINSLMNE